MPTFRLLDGSSGWSLRPEGSHGLALTGGSLSLAADESAGARRTAPWQAWLAWSPTTHTWWLAGRHGLARLGPCDEEFSASAVRRPVRTVVACGGLVAVLLAHGGGTVLILDQATGHQVGEAQVLTATGLVCTPTGGVCGAGCGVGVVDTCRRVHLLDPSGLVCGVDPEPPTQTSRLPDGARTWPDGFHLPGRGTFDRRGRRTADDVPISGTDQDRVLLREGRLLSTALDSGLPGCRWHRARVDAEVPPGTSISLALATTDAAPGPGVPDPADWFEAAPGASDVLLPDAPGRWAYVRVALTGDGHATPVLHRVRLDLPRHGPADALPDVYAEDPRARDFTERFLGLFGSFVEQVDEAIARRADLLDADALPDDALGWLAGTIGLGFEPEMPATRRRALIAAAPDLYRRRGTPHGLVDTLRISLGVSAVIEEPGTLRPWGAVGAAHLGGVRLFGRSAARVRLGTARIGHSRLISDGDPDLDAVRAGAHRVRVHVGPVDDDGRPVDVALVARVVRSQTPANVVVSVVPVRRGAATGEQRVGIDTLVLAPDPAVVGGTALGRGGRVTSRGAPGLPVVGTQRVDAAPLAQRTSRPPGRRLVAVGGPCSDLDERSEP